MQADIKLSFDQLLELVKNLSEDEKLRLSQELEKEVIQSKLSELLKSFRTEELSMDEITQEVETVRQDFYDRRRAY